MNTRNLKLAGLGLAVAAAGFGTAALADEHIVVHTAPPVIYEHGPARYAQNDYGWEPGWHHGCRAPDWDPNARYMPGQVVWREGKLYMATDVSASVYNVNSPPEWTPKYWVRARCR